MNVPPFKKKSFGIAKSKKLAITKIMAILIRLLLMSMVANKLFGSLSNLRILLFDLLVSSSIPFMSAGESEKQATSELLIRAELIISKINNSPNTMRVVFTAIKGKKRGIDRYKY